MRHDTARRMFHSVIKAYLSLISAYMQCTYIGPTVSEMEHAVGTFCESNSFHCTHSEHLKYISTNCFMSSFHPMGKVFQLSGYLHHFYRQSY